MQYDGYDPFGFAPNKGEVKIKKKIVRKKRTMASIHQYKALSDPINIAKAKSSEELEGIDRDLYLEGVRPGQVWVLPHGTEVYYLSFIGYHDKGFIMLNLRAIEKSPLPTVSLFKYPRKLKMDLLIEIQNKKATLLSTVIPSLIDKHGEALPGREMDVTLAALMARPTFWHDHNKNRNYFLSICENGHHRVSIGYLPSGQSCDQFCFNAAHTEAMSLLTDIILDKIYYGKDSNPGFFLRSSESDKFSMATTAWTFIESVYETYKIIGTNKAGTPRNKFEPEDIEPEENDWRRKTKAWLNKNEIRSGFTFPLEIEAIHTSSALKNKKLKARLHLRLCGNLHVEISENEIFTGKTDGDLLKTICEESKTPYLKIGRDVNIQLDDKYTFVKCPHCHSNELILCVKEEEINPNKRKLKRVEPIVIENPKPKRIASPGDVVKYRGSPALYLKERVNKEGMAHKILVLKRDRRATSVSPTEIRPLPQSQENKEIFFDDNNILKKNFSIDNWYKLIVPGSRIRIHPAVKNPSLRHLAGFVVTTTDFAYQSDGKPSVAIIESDSIVKLDTEALPCETFPIEQGMFFEVGDRNFELKETKAGELVFDDEDNRTIIFSEAGFQLALMRDKVKVAQVDTVDNLLKHL